MNYKTIKYIGVCYAKVLNDNLKEYRYIFVPKDEQNIAKIDEGFLTTAVKYMDIIFLN